MKRIIIAALISLTIFSEASLASVKKDVKRGNVLYNNKNYDSAAKLYEEALVKKPNSTIANFNLGSALYRKGSYHNAVESFNKAIAAQDRRIVPIADYNIGNSHYRIGNIKEKSDISSAKELYETALKFYKRSIDLDPNDKDAKFNYEFVENKLKELKEKEHKREQEKKDEKNEREKKQESKEKAPQEERSRTSGASQGKEEEKKPQEKEKEKRASGKDQEEKSQSEKEKEEAQKQAGREAEAKKEAAGGKEPEKREEAEKEDREEQKGLQAYQTPQAIEEAREMSAEEANMLLEGHKGEEATARMIRMRKKPIDMPKPFKDW